MAHEIVDGMDCCLTRDQDAPAWHGLDKRVPNITLDVLAREGFGRPTQLVQAAAVDPATGATVISDTTRAIVSPNLDRSEVKVVGFVGDRYTMSGSNGYLDTIGRVVRPLLDAGLIDIVSAGTLRGYRRAYASCEIKNASLRADIRKNDAIEILLNFADSLDLSLRFNMWDSTTRIVCSNTLAEAFKNGSRKHKANHTASLAGKLDGWAEYLVNKQRELDETAEVFRAMANKQVDSQALDMYLRECFDLGLDDKPRNGTGYTQALQAHDEDSARGTLWGAYNAAQATLQWFGKGGRTTQARLDNVWFGQGAAQNQRFLDAAMARL